jgi:hypothetical protein
MGLRKSWVDLLSRKAKINRVKAALPGLLLDFQDNPPPRRHPWDEPSQLDRLGITKAWPMDRSSVSGRVYLVPQARGGFAGTEHTIGDWVTRVLRREADVAAKLAAHPDVAERHAFIWATITSDMEVQTQLEPGDDHPFPVTPPTLPSGVTHVWMGGQMWRQGGAGVVSRPRLVADSLDRVVVGEPGVLEKSGSSAVPELRGKFCLRLRQRADHRSR